MLRGGRLQGGSQVIQKFAARGIQTNVKKLLFIKENEVSQSKEFSAFLWRGSCQSLDSMKSLLSYAPQLSGSSVLGFDFSHPYLVPRSLREWHSLTAAGIVFPWAHSGLGNSQGRVADGRDILVYSYGRKYSVSHWCLLHLRALLFPSGDWDKVFVQGFKAVILDLPLWK